MLHKQELIVYPTSRAIRSYIQENKKLNTLLPFTLTIDEFLKKSIVLKNELSYIDEEQRVLYLKEAINNVNISKLGLSSNFSKFLKEYEYIYRFFLELSSEKCEIEKLYEFDTYDYYYEHLEILKVIRSNYVNILAKNQLLDKIILDNNYTINQNFLSKFATCNIIFEGYFTKIEFDIVTEVSKYIELTIEFHTNTYNKRSIEVFSNFLDVKLDNNFKYKVNITNKRIIEKTALKNKTDINEIKSFSSRINQIAYIKSIIASSVNDGYKLSKIALVLPDESFSSIIDLFDNENYFNYAMGKNINQTHIYQVSNAINLYIIEDDEKYIENLKYLNISKDSIDKIVKPLWNKIVTKQEFETLIGFIKSFENNKELLEKFDELVYKLNILFFLNKNDIKLKDLYKIYLQKMNLLKLDDINSGKITVLGLLETRTIEFDVVIICDFNEDYIPKVSVKDKFLSSNLKNNVGLPNSIDRQNLQKYYYKRLIDNSKNIYISYVQSDLKNISRFANELFIESIDEKIYDKNYKDILFFNKNVKYFDEHIIDKIDLSNYTWSATSLKTFLECKRKFYLQYIYKIKEHSLSLKPKSYELGNIIHNILEVYYKSNSSDIRKLFNEHMSNNSFLLLDLEIWKSKLEEFIKIDSEHLRNKNIIDLEKPFSINYRGMKLKGVIDRIEKFEDNYNVIDYKTSNTLKVDSLKNYEKSKDFQLEFYYLALKEIFKTDKIKAYYYDLSNLKLIEEVLLNEKIEILDHIFDEMKANSKKELSFNKCEEKTTCLYCPYKIICNRE
jgi:inactivated superfamily I helicase/CRISPR/Cas system-associated exonuclease Cas4 (RecB family)